MHSRLLRRLAISGRTARIRTCKGMKMLILEDGGRVLGLWAPDSDENFFWVNPRISDDPESHWKSKWPNPGGDRCWLSPVCGIQIDRRGGHVRYQVPPGVDPGFRHVERCKDGTIRILNVGKIFMRLRGKDDTFALERRLSWSENPLRNIGEGWVKKLSYAGYSQRINLESFSCIGNKLSPWSILQLPIGGKIVMPVYGARSRVRRAIGIRNTDLLEFRDGCVQLKADGGKDCMVSIPPQMSTGRIGYVRQAGKDWTLVVRSFNVDLSGEYMNCFSGMSKKPGHAVQCRVVSDGDASHVELHQHLPCNRTIEVGGTIHTWCFSGSRENILHAAACLTEYEPVPSKGRYCRTGGL